MGLHDVHTDASGDLKRQFGRAVLEDIRALERLCAAGAIESGIRRVGAEQEMFLVDEQGRPAPIAVEVLSRLNDPSVATELARFNLEYNLPAQELNGDALRTIEERLSDAVERVREAAVPLGGDVLLVGILPSLELADLGLDNLTPETRYRELNRVMCELTGGRFPTHIMGVDELDIVHDNVMLEACNTSFQVHFQVSAEEFAPLYNLAQVVTAPTLAAAGNSPVLLQHRLWRETRIALFQQSIDVRSRNQKQRSTRRRVWFGDKWINESIVEIYRDDVSHFPPLLTAETGESSTAVLDRGGVPELRALRMHNGTVYRWNRACYGVLNGRPHLRIENRTLPAGPTVLDAVANAAFFIGLMVELSERYSDVRERFTFDHVLDNFVAAARYGLNATFRWEDGRVVAVPALILGELLPMARSGLERRGMPAADIDRYLGVIGRRVETGRTGSEWMLEALERLSPIRSRHTRYQVLTRTLLARQRTGTPVHEWAPPRPEDEGDWRDRFRTVAQVMTTDLFTVQADMSVELAASIMYWKQVRHLPVEDADGKLVGLLSHRSLLKLVADGRGTTAKPVPVDDVMRRDPLTVSPETSCLDAIHLMYEHQVSCLPVLDQGRLAGIVTDRDFSEAAARLFEDEMGGGESKDRGV